MIKSIENVGEFEGDKATMHAGVLPRVLLWPERTSLKHEILRSKLDYRVLMLPKQLPWLARFFSSYSKQTINFKKPPFTVTRVPAQDMGAGCRKRHPYAPHPRVRSMGTTRKFFPNFHLSNNHVLHSTKSCLEG